MDYSFIILMNLRTKTVLEVAIKEYIKDGKPVSSKELAKSYNFGVKDATIRNELNRLTKDGFLAQTHTSGGRVPTDKGYKFFVENALSNAIDSKRILNNKYSHLASDLRQGDLRGFIEEVSGETKLLGVGKKEKSREVYKSGFDELFNRLDLDTKQEFYEIARDFEMIDERLEALRNRVFEHFNFPRVFIGRQSPITNSENLSVILDSYDIGGQKFMVAIIGPKRMDYDKNMKLLKLLHDQING